MPRRFSLREWLTESKLSLFVTFVTETAAPAFIFMWGKSVWFPEQPPPDSDASEVRIYWTIALSLLTIWYIYYKRVTKEGARQPLMDLRHFLLLGREFATSRTNSISALRPIIPHPATKEQIIDTFRTALDFDRTISDLLYKLFLGISNGNSNLDRHFRVTLMEPEGDVLKIKYFANSENEPPRCLGLGRGFRKKEGAAGWAWEYMRPFGIADLDKYRKKVAKGKADRSQFIACHDEQLKMKSIICVPVASLTAHGEHLRGVVCIDTDVPYFFREGPTAERDFRIRTFLIIRTIRLAYEVRDLLTELS